VGLAGWRSDRPKLSAMGSTQRGVATIEFYIVALLALLPLCLGMLQTFLLLMANHQIDYAAFAAARLGATNGAELSGIRRGFVQAMTPMFVSTNTAVDRGNVVEKVAAAFARASLDVALFGQFQILSPSAAAQSDFAIDRNGERVIPNDALEYRSASAGDRSNISLQEANILRLSVTYCQRLIVPFAAQLVVATLRRLDDDLEHARCYLAGRIPLTSEGVTPMQSDFKIAAR
jgi:Flp pilus assembly protein TadG